MEDRAGVVAGSAAPTSDPLSVLGGDRRIFVIPDYKILFVSLAKNACTTMKWVMADLAGEDLTSFKAGLLPFLTEELAVHTRSRFQKALRLNQLEPATRAQIHPDNGWFVFSIVRDPRARLFSAWQDKFLLQDPVYRRHRKNGWPTEFSADPAVIAAQFSRFVDGMLADPTAALHHDSHFDSQINLLHLDVVPYSRVYPIEHMEQLRTDLLAHVTQLGWSGELLFRRSNETPLRATAQMFAGDVRAKVEQLYRADFEQFGHLWDFAKIEQVPPWSDAALRELELRAALIARLTEVQNIAKRYRRRSAKANKRITRLERELKRMKRQQAAPTGARRVVRRVRRALRQGRAGSPSVTG